MSVQTDLAPSTYGQDPSTPCWTVGQYQEMIARGILTQESRVELLEGFIVRKMTRNPRHDSTIQRMFRPLLAIIPAGWDLRIQLALELSDSQPEPDFAVVRGSPDTFSDRHPTAADTALVIEVADSTLLRDQLDKSRIYATAGIPEYWVVNLVERQVEVYRTPRDGEYTVRELFQSGDAMPLDLEQKRIGLLPVSELIG